MSEQRCGACGGALDYWDADDGHVRCWTCPCGVTTGWRSDQGELDLGLTVRDLTDVANDAWHAGFRRGAIVMAVLITVAYWVVFG